MEQLSINYQMEMPKIVQRFFDFHSKHPEIYAWFKKYAFELLGKKPNRPISAQMIIERIRYEIFIKEDDIEIYKLNNDFAAGYSRIFMKEFPHYDGLITKRKSVYDDFI